MMSAIHRAFRNIATAVDHPPRLTRFSLHPPNIVEVEYANGDVYRLPAEFLRVYSPAADSKIRPFAGEKVIYGRRCVGIMSGEPVGNYGVRYIRDNIDFYV